MHERATQTAGSGSIARQHRSAGHSRKHASGLNRLVRGTGLGGRLTRDHAGHAGHCLEEEEALQPLALGHLGAVAVVGRGRAGGCGREGTQSMGAWMGLGRPHTRRRRYPQRCSLRLASELCSERHSCSSCGAPGAHVEEPAQHLHRKVARLLVQLQVVPASASACMHEQRRAA